MAVYDRAGDIMYICIPVPHVYRAAILLKAAVLEVKGCFMSYNYWVNIKSYTVTSTTTICVHLCIYMWVGGVFIYVIYLHYFYKYACITMGS